MIVLWLVFALLLFTGFRAELQGERGGIKVHPTYLAGQSEAKQFMSNKVHNSST